MMPQSGDLLAEKIRLKQKAVLRSRGRRTAGFTLVEVLVALAIVTTSLAAIASLIAANARGTRSVDQRLSLTTTARTVLGALPARAKLAPGRVTGETAGLRWRTEVQPLAVDVVDPRVPASWVPQAVVISVQSPTGQLLRIDTVRLIPGPGAGR